MLHVCYSVGIVLLIIPKTHMTIQTQTVMHRKYLPLKEDVVCCLNKFTPLFLGQVDCGAPLLYRPEVV